MNAFVTAIAGLCTARPLDEKRLLAPTRRVGNQWLDAAARAGRPVLNVRVETLRSLAVELAAPALADAGLTVAPRRAEQLLVERTLHALLRDGKLPWLGKAAPGAGLAATLLSSLAELRLEGVADDRLRPGVFEPAAKAADLKLLVGEYGRLLDARGLADYARVLRLAAARLAADPDALGRGTLMLLPEDLATNGLERRLLEAMPPARLLRLAVDPPGIPARIRFMCAAGAGNEVRAVLRSCLESGTSLDEVEVLHTDPAYAQAVAETFAAIARPGVEPTDDAPVTFAEGLPCALSRPGRALSLWLRWMDEGYPQTVLVAMVREGLLETDGIGGGRGIGFSRLARLLRSVPIGQERERYLARIDERIAAGRTRLEALVAGDAADDGDADGKPGEDPEVRREQLAGALDGLVLVRGLVARLMDISPAIGAGGPEIIAAAQRFLATSCRSAGRFDNFAGQKLREELDEMAHWLERVGGGDAADVRSWLAELPAQTRVGGSGPQPGCVHVDHVRSGGHTGRPHTFIIGLDDRRFPGAGLQDPLLLDSERALLDAAMPTAGRRLEETTRAFAMLLGRLRGTATLCWPSRDVVEDADLAPSQVVIDAFRSASGHPAAEQRHLVDAAGTPVSMAPAVPEQALDSGEWWLWRFTGDEAVANADAVLQRLVPHLARGLGARAQRASAAFTIWDGRVPLAGSDLDPTAPQGKVLSSNGLEAAGGCPRKFFYRYALGIVPPEELVVDPERWLDPRATGSLLHELFEHYVREILRAGRPADVTHGRTLILGMLERKLAEYRVRYPSPSLAAFARERDLLVLAAETFVREEERQALETGSEPVFLEASLGMPPGEHGSALDHPVPIPVELPGGLVIRARGRVDRIDRTGGPGGGWAIWDYKTGGTFGYDRSDPFPEGRKIQPYLYLRMVERRLRDATDPRASVSTFGYFFPGEKGRGDRIGWEAGQLAAGGEVLVRLCRIIASGAFAATTDAGRDCGYCDYRTACGDVGAQARASVRKVLAGEPLLAPLGELRAKSLAKAVGRREDEE